MNPSDDTTLRLAIGHNKEIDCLFYLNRGNGREMFAKLMAIPTINLTTRGTDDKYIDLIGTFDGYSVDVTFLDEPNDIVEIVRHDAKAGYPEEVKDYEYWNYMTAEEWNDFSYEFYRINKYNGKPNALKNFLKTREEKGESFWGAVAGAFVFCNTSDEFKWLEISQRTSPIV